MNAKKDACFSRVTETQVKASVEIEASGDYFHNFFEFFQTFTSVLKLESNSEKIFSISARKHCEKKKWESHSVTSITKM